MSLRKHSWEYYKYLVHECSNLSCSSYVQLESHHIVPISAGGTDEFDNIIILCRKCHMSNHNGYHVDWMLHYDKLHKWKDVVDSHIVYDTECKKWISFEEDNSVELLTNAEEEKSINDEEMIPWEFTGRKMHCYNCGKNKTSFMFHDGFYCIRCIKIYTDKLNPIRRSELLSSEVPICYEGIKIRRR